MNCSVNFLHSVQWVFFSLRGRISTLRESRSRQILWNKFDPCLMWGKFLLFCFWSQKQEKVNSNSDWPKNFQDPNLRHAPDSSILLYHSHARKFFWKKFNLLVTNKGAIPAEGRQNLTTAKKHKQKMDFDSWSIGSEKKAKQFEKNSISGKAKFDKHKHHAKMHE